MALLTGVGFTMSLFIGTLAFEAPAYEPLVRLGVLAGTALSALAGCAMLLLSRSRG
jgi:NhaA family Na+:H+ antiporter